MHSQKHLLLRIAEQASFVEPVVDRNADAGDENRRDRDAVKRIDDAPQLAKAVAEHRSAEQAVREDLRFGRKIVLAAEQVALRDQKFDRRSRQASDDAEVEQ